MSSNYIVPHVQQYWVHYDKKTGVIRCISNEPTQLDEASLEITLEEYLPFVTHEKKMTDHIVGYARSVDGTSKKSIIQIAEQLYGFRNNIFEWINQPPKKNTEMVVTWNGVEKNWKFSLSKKAQKRLDGEVVTKTIFFVMLKNDFDFLIRNIVIDVETLIKQGDVVIPFTSNLENKIDKISISSQIFFESYGLKIHEQN